jgi:hypothetical protein
MSISMKAVVLFLMVFVIAPFAMANAANAQTVTCTQAVLNANNLSASIASSSTSYWTHFQNFVGYTYGKNHSLANWKALAATELAAANSLRSPMPNTLASFQAAIATVQALNCLPATTLQSLIESTTTNARRINFGKIPVAENG